MALLLVAPDTGALGGPSPQDVAIARNLALRDAGYPRGIGMPRSEWERGERNDNLRHAAFLGSEVMFTPHDICMVYRMWTGSIFGENAKRPFRILAGDQPARDKRNRIRQFGSLSYARRVAREIEGKQ